MARKKAICFIPTAMSVLMGCSLGGGNDLIGRWRCVSPSWMQFLDNSTVVWAIGFRTIKPATPARASGWEFSAPDVDFGVPDEKLYRYRIWEPGQVLLNRDYPPGTQTTVTAEGPDGAHWLIRQWPPAPNREFPLTMLWDYRIAGDTLWLTVPTKDEADEGSKFCMRAEAVRRLASTRTAPPRSGRLPATHWPTAPNLWV